MKKLLFAALFLFCFASLASALCICAGNPASQECKQCGAAGSSPDAFREFRGSLSAIALDCGVLEEDILKANGLSSESVIQTGKVLRVPGGSCSSDVSGATGTGCYKTQASKFTLNSKYAKAYAEWKDFMIESAIARAGDRCYKGYDLVAITAAIATKESGFGTAGRYMTGCGKPSKGKLLPDYILYNKKEQLKCTIDLLVKGLNGQRAIGRNCPTSGDLACLLGHYCPVSDGCSAKYPSQIESWSKQYRSLG